jgi:ATP-dependent helicase/nuclease subunit B
MASIARLPLETISSGASPWGGVVEAAKGWAVREGVDLRNAVLLVPFAQHLPWARRAWAQSGGWMPRIETTQTLAQARGPGLSAGESQITFDASIDRLTAARMLRSQPWMAAWARRDDKAFDEAVAALVTTAHALARAAAALHPSLRDAHWQQGRALLIAGGGPGASERLLARVAMEWAALAPEPATDRLFDLQPSAWIAVQAGGSDALTAQLLLSAASSEVPCAVIDCDFDLMQMPAGTRISLTECESFEHEAQCAAAQVLAHLQRGEVPVGLIAQDRVLVRRVRALLERQQVSLLDETGWKLSTTRAAAQLMNLLQAAKPTAAADVLLDWLKASVTPWPGLGDARGGCTALEALCRKRGWSQIAAIDDAQLPPAAALLWRETAAVLDALREPRRRPLGEWLAALRQALDTSGALQSLVADEAGIQVLRSLHLHGNATLAGGVPSQTFMTLDDFVDWVDGVLEEASFIPEAPLAPASVVITPLARVMLRPFAALVFPGADERHLGASASPHPWLSDAQAVAMGLPGERQRREAEATAFAHATAVPLATLMHRRVDGSEPLAVSPLVERLSLVLQRAGRSIATWVDPRSSQSIAPMPVHMPAPPAANLLPHQLSASACEALRACPYRFFVLHLLRAHEADELDAELEKRDYGTWLHAVLLAFHQTRTEPDTAQIELARLLAIGDAQQAAHGLADADFLPFAASFGELAPRYIAWLHERDAQGASWWRGEQDHRIDLPQIEGVALQGRIDRADRVRTAQGEAVELIDYKTGSADVLRQQVRQPLEDTQLAFYAAIVQPATEAPLRAMYLALDGVKGIEQVPHPNVEDSAQALVQGLADDLSRIRQGAGLPARGEGRVCEHCEARGLCRRDHWSEPHAA